MLSMLYVIKLLEAHLGAELYQSNAVFLNRCAMSYFQVCRQFVCLYFYYSFRRKEGIWVAIKWFYLVFKKNSWYQCATKFFLMLSVPRVKKG